VENSQKNWIKHSQKRSFDMFTVDPTVDTYIISFPKCGRTWLKLMIGQAIVGHLGISNTNLLDTLLDSKFPLAKLHPSLPKIQFTHDDDPHWKKPNELMKTKTHYQNTKVIFLVRDPRDLVVSTYFEQKKRVQFWLNSLTETPHLQDYQERLNPYEGDLSSYLNEEVGSIDTIINFYNIWAKNKDVPREFLLTRYEDIHQNPHGELRRIIEFLGIANIKYEVLDEAVNYASFDNMRQMETAEMANSYSLKATDKNDPESYKTRKGTVGGFVEYLSSEEIQAINCKINQSLADLYGYKNSKQLT